MNCNCGKPAVATRVITTAGVDGNNKFVVSKEKVYYCDFCASCHDENALEARYS